MLGLPEKTVLKKVIPKKVLYSKFVLTGSEREAYDRAMKQLCLVAELSERTLGLPMGEGGRAIFVLEIALKEPCSEMLLRRLCKLIDQRLIVVESLAGKARLSALWQDILLQSEWQNEGQAHLMLEGLDLATVWENCLRCIGGLPRVGALTLTEQIERKVRREQLTQEMAKLRSKIQREKQPTKKFAYHEQLVKLRSEWEELGWRS